MFSIEKWPYGPYTVCRRQVAAWLEDRRVPLLSTIQENLVERCINNHNYNFLQVAYLFLYFEQIESIKIFKHSQSTKHCFIIGQGDIRKGELVEIKFFTFWNLFVLAKIKIYK